MVPVRELRTLRSGSVPAADPAGLTHLQFRRYAGCPICNLHLRSFTGRHEELIAAGIREIAVFHSTADTLDPYQQDLPFDLVADPSMQLYRTFAVETSMRALTSPKAWIAAARGWSRNLPPGSDTGAGGHLGLPADFLIAPDGKILACKYGSHANDHWTVDQLLAEARRHTGS
ncbi:AhpC/TSA family protein [Rhodococcus ruber]|nr:AhpC/TSA family protein [Rhodococcus ruber]